MKQPVPRGLSRTAFIIVVILGGYVAFSAISLGLGTGNWLLVLLTTLAVLSSLPYINRRFGDKLPILNTLGKFTKSSGYRRYLGPILSENVAPKTVQTGMQAAIGALTFGSPFILILAVAGALSIFHPVPAELKFWLVISFFVSSMTMAIFFMTIRLRMPYNLTSAISAIVIYAPIFTIALGSQVMQRDLLRDDAFRPSLILILFVCCCPSGQFILTIMPYNSDTIVDLVCDRARQPSGCRSEGLQNPYAPACLHFPSGFRKNSAPAPAFISHPLYQRIEIALSIASYTAIMLLLLSSFWR